MDDYISREAEIQFFNDWIDDLDKQINASANYSHLRSDYKVCKTQLLDCIHAIKEMPAADVRPVKYGRWIELENPNYSSFDPTRLEYDLLCSNCGAKHYGKERNFCPNCGADMRGK